MNLASTRTLLICAIIAMMIGSAAARRNQHGNVSTNASVSPPKQSQGFYDPLFGWDLHAIPTSSPQSSPSNNDDATSTVAFVNKKNKRARKQRGRKPSENDSRKKDVSPSSKK